MRRSGLSLCAVRCCCAIAACFPAGVIRAAPPKADAGTAGIEEDLRDYLSGNGFLNRGLYELAVAEYRKFLSAHSEHEKAPVARYGLAVALFRLERFEEAGTELSALQAVSAFEYAAEVGTMAGQCHLAAGRFDKAAEAFRPIADGSQDHALADDAAAGLVEALYRDEEYPSALASAGQFTTRWSASPLRDRVELFAGLSQMSSGDYAAAAERFGTFLSTFPKSPFSDQVALRLAQCLQKSDQARQAIRHYEDVLERGNAEHRGDALLALGGLYHQEGQYDQAAKSLDQLLEAAAESPEAARARFLRAQVHFAVGEFAEARNVFEAAGKSQPELADQGAFWAAKCLLRQEKYAEAAKKLRHAAEQHPDSVLLPEMLYDRAVALFRAEQPAEAIAALEQFHERFGDHELSPAALHLLAGVTHRGGDYPQSSKWCREFLAKYSEDPNAAAVSFLAAENEFLSGEFGRAADGYRAFLKAYEKDERVRQARFRLAICLYRLDKFDEAEPLLSQAAEQAEADTAFRPALLALGDIYFDRGEWEAAEKFLTQYHAGARDAAGGEDALIKLAYCTQRQERFDVALAHYEQFLAQYPQSENRVQAEFERGQVLVALKRMDEARGAFNKVLEADSQSKFRAFALNHLGAIAMQKGDAKAAAELYARAGQSSGGESIAPDLLFQEGLAHVAGRDFAAAEVTLRRLVDAHPDYAKAPQAAAQLAIALSRQDRCEDAIGAIEGLERRAGERLDPALRASVLYEKAWCLRTLGRGDEAAAAYRKLLSLTPGGETELHAMLELGELEAAAKRYGPAVEVLAPLYGKLHAAGGTEVPELVEKCAYRLGVCELELEHYDRALKLLDELIDQFPRSNLVASALFFAGEAAFKLGRHEQAVAYFERLANGFPSDAAAGPGVLRAGECLAVLQRWPASERMFDDYLAKFSDSPSWYQAQFGVGWARENQKRYDEAIAAYEKVIARHEGPTTARAQFQIGQCQFAKGDYDAAIRELLKVDILYAYPQWSAAALYEAGRAFRKQGKTAEARQHFQQVVDKFKDSEWAGLALKQLAESTSSAAVPGH